MCNFVVDICRESGNYGLCICLCTFGALQGVTINVSGISSAEGVAGHEQCVVCGRDNPFSLRLTFHTVGGGTVEGSFTGGPHLQGYEGILHGGVISAVLDSAMAHCLLLQNIRAVTADLRVRFLHSIPCSSRVTIRAWLTCAVSTLYELKAEAWVEGQKMAKASAKFMASGMVDGGRP